MSYVCPRGGSISVIVSQLSNITRDRVWDFACKASFRGIINCSWSDYVNNYDEGVHFSCPSESLISGVQNMRSLTHKQRKWKFQCCGRFSVCFANCVWTQYVNRADEYFSWLVPGDFYLVGIGSSNGEVSALHQWQYRYCVMFPTVMPVI
ncbi:hemagglutinin/amebocyte aggregation factor-like isoform X2 [Scyliorhinus torazame]